MSTVIPNKMSRSNYYFSAMLLFHPLRDFTKPIGRQSFHSSSQVHTITYWPRIQRPDKSRECEDGDFAVVQLEVI